MNNQQSKFLQNLPHLFFFFFVASLGLVYPLGISDFSKAIYLLGLVAFGIFYLKDWKKWLCEHKPEKIYLAVIVAFVLYGLLLVLVWTFLVPDNPQGLRKRFSDVEDLIVLYFVLSLFCCFAGLKLSQKTFERAMCFFSISTVLSGIFLLFVYHDFSLLISSPSSFFKEVLQTRFMENPTKISWINVFLKDYSFFPTFGALVCIPFIGKFGGWRKAAMIVLFVCNIALLFFTINKGTIIGFGLAVLLTVFYVLRKFSWQKKMFWGAAIVVCSCAVVFLLPESIKVRFTDMVNETLLFYETNHDSGSTSARLTIWKTLLSHADGFWLFGDGPVYATDKLRLYLTEAGYESYVQNGYIYHNMYLSFFHHFGIVGLLFLIFSLLYPVYSVIRQKRFSLFLTSVAIVFLCAYAEDRYTKSIILLFFLFFSYFYVDYWRKLEEKL